VQNYWEPLQSFNKVFQLLALTVSIHVRSHLYENKQIMLSATHNNLRRFDLFQYTRNRTWQNASSSTGLRPTFAHREYCQFMFMILFESLMHICNYAFVIFNIATGDFQNRP